MSLEEGFELPSVEVRGPAATAMADYTSMTHDFEFAAAAFREASAIDVESNPIVGQALTDAALVAYRRAFTSGRSHAQERASRLRVPEHLLAELTDRQKMLHEAILDLANKHIAHRVNDEEHSVVAVFLDARTNPPTVFSSGVMQVRMVGFVGQEAVDYGDLSDHWRSRMTSLIEEADAVIWADVTAELARQSKQ